MESKGFIPLWIHPIQTLRISFLVSYLYICIRRHIVDKTIGVNDQCCLSDRDGKDALLLDFGHIIDAGNVWFLCEMDFYFLIINLIKATLK